MFAEQGYVVVMPNPTGSTGYGQAFTDGIATEWGGRPYNDLVNCFEYIEGNLPYVDTQNAVALGASYGGYMISKLTKRKTKTTTAQVPFNLVRLVITGLYKYTSINPLLIGTCGPIKEPEKGTGPWIANPHVQPKTDWIQGQPLGRRFKALVCHDGIFSTMSDWATEELFFVIHDMGGMLWERRDLYEKWDPAAHTGDWATPQLIVHSELDYRLPISEGLAAFNVLQARGVASRLVVFPDENHVSTSCPSSSTFFLSFFIFSVAIVAVVAVVHVLRAVVGCLTPPPPSEPRCLSCLYSTLPYLYDHDISVEKKEDKNRSFFTDILDGSGS